MRKDILLGALLAAGTLLTAPGANAPTRVDVTTLPPGATVAVDGTLRGKAPLQIFDLAAGPHLLHVEAPGYRPADACVTVAEASTFLQRHFELVREKALVFVETEPAGATVRAGGIALGVTPLFVDSLPTDEETKLELVRPGYRPAKAVARPVGRTPCVVRERLIIDSGALELVTEPAGAEVVVNGIARGVTPVRVAGIAKGDATVSFRKAGYRSETRHVVVSPDGRSQTVAVTLAPLPATLQIVSTPEGAKVFVDGNYQGKTPTSAPQLAAGEHRVRLELDGHAAEERTVTVENGGESTERFTLTSVLGRLEIATVPAGAKVSVDGKAVGTTRAIAGSNKSAVLTVEKVAAGDRAVVVSAPGCQDVMRKVKVPPKGTGMATIVLKRLFVPDTEIETVQGTTRRGVLVGGTDRLDGIHLEVQPGVEQVFPHDTIRQVRPLR